MCMFCAAVPVAASTGLSIDNKLRRELRAQGKEPARVRPVPLLTAIAILILLTGSVIVHLKFPRFW
jgi:hypothetical protein